MGAGKLYADGLVPGFIYDYTFTEVGPTGQYEELENGMQKWIADNNWTLERITDDTKLSDAYLQTAAVGTLYGGLFSLNAIWSIWKFFIKPFFSSRTAARDI